MKFCNWILLNFQYRIIEPPDGQWVSKDQNGTWTGLIVHAMYGHTNFSMGKISITKEREEVFDFCFTFYFDSLGFVAALPKQLPKYQEIFKPFLGQYLDLCDGLNTDFCSNLLDHPNFIES